MFLRSKGKKFYPVGLFAAKGTQLGSKKKKMNVNLDLKQRSKNKILGKFFDTSFVYYDED